MGNGGLFDILDLLFGAYQFILDLLPENTLSIAAISGPRDSQLKTRPESQASTATGFTNHQKVPQMWEFQRPSLLCREGMATQGTWYWADSKP
jgi:hypothetical protein